MRITDEIDDAIVERKQIHEVIWLQPWCNKCDNLNWSSDGRTWCQDDAWGPCAECGRESVKYVLAAAICDGVVVPRELTPAIACALEGCDPPEKQSPEAIEALMIGYRDTWRNVLAATAPQPGGDKR